jgi:ADP-ribose pyrophosphatase YjhB (NUDIX family)
LHAASTPTIVYQVIGGMMGLRRLIYRLAGGWVQQVYARFFRAMTLGVRVAVIDAQNRVLLVKHSYVPGWFLPGGGVERHETLAQAALREIREEGSVIATEVTLHGIFSQESVFRGDHVVCFITRKFSRLAWEPNAEIDEAGFFSKDDLPPDLTDATRRRLAEIFDGVPISEYW